MHQNPCRRTSWYMYTHIALVYHPAMLLHVYHSQHAFWYTKHNTTSLWYACDSWYTSRVLPYFGMGFGIPNPIPAARNAGMLSQSVPLPWYIQNPPPDFVVSATDGKLKLKTVCMGTGLREASPVARCRTSLSGSFECAKERLQEGVCPWSRASNLRQGLSCIKYTRMLKSVTRLLSAIVAEDHQDIACHFRAGGQICCMTHSQLKRCYTNMPRGDAEGAVLADLR